MTDELPEKIDLREQFGPVYDQGELNMESSCVISESLKFLYTFGYGAGSPRPLPKFYKKTELLYYNEKEIE
jgi:hypothetical protein